MLLTERHEHIFLQKYNFYLISFTSLSLFQALHSAEYNPVSWSFLLNCVYILKTLKLASVDKEICWHLHLLICVFTQQLPTLAFILYIRLASKDPTLDHYWNGKITLPLLGESRKTTCFQNLLLECGVSPRHSLDLKAGPLKSMPNSLQPHIHPWHIFKMLEGKSHWVRWGGL